LNDAVNAVARLTQPVIAAITGYALGGGLELALAADFRIVAENALLGLPEITLGVIPGGGGTQRLPRLIGVTKAKEMIFTGRPVDGAQAVDIGLASRAVPADQVFAEALKMARRLSVGATAALAAAKRAIDDGLDGSLSAGLELEGRKFAEIFGTEDQKIGMTSFVREGPGKATFVGR
jgi:enoyl-CoA hydratase